MRNLEDIGSARILVALTDDVFNITQALLAIPHGELSTYGEIAENLNQPQASRAVGAAVGPAVAAAVHLLAGIPNGSMAEMVFPAHPLMAELVKDPLLVDRTGHIELSERPGLGIEFDPKVVSQYRVGG